MGIPGTDEAGRPRMQQSRRMSSPSPAVASVTAADAIDAFAEARERTLALVASVSDDDLERVHSTLMSPLVWDLGHIAAFEDLWLVHRYGDQPMLRDDLADVYDAFETPRAGRGELPFLGPGRRARLPRPGPRAHARGDRRARRRRRPASTRWCSATSTSTTRRCCRRSQLARLRGYEPAADQHAPVAATRPTSALTGLELIEIPGRASARSAPRRAASPTTTSARCTAPTSAAT